jgi:hypothetical protein
MAFSGQRETSEVLPANSLAGAAQLGALTAKNQKLRTLTYSLNVVPY